MSSRRLAIPILGLPFAGRAASGVNSTMIWTSSLALVLGLMSNSNSMTWQTDYGSAMKLAAKEKKPLVVFIGHGKEGVNTLVENGGITSIETKVLSDSFISLYVDADSEAGKSLTTSFNMTEGIVISDRTGSLQAVRHEGNVSHSELNEYLTKYSEPNKVITTTEYRSRVRGPIMTYITSPERPRPVVNTIQAVGGFVTGGTTFLSGSS
jgi:hypothetical protein